MITGRKVNLRLVSQADLDIVASYMNNIHWRGKYETVALVPEHQMRKKFAETGFWEDDEGTLHITGKDDRVLGLVNYWRPFTRPTRLAYEISFAIDNPEDWGKGFMSEAVSLFVPYLFSIKTTDRIQAITHPENTASRRVLEKSGFKLEGVLRRLYVSRGVPIDVQMFSVLRGESPPFQPGPS